MQFYVIALALIGFVAADVSHLHLGQAAGYSYSSASSSEAVVPGGDSSSYQPEHLIPQHLKQAQVEVTPGSDSSSYQPEHLIPQHLKQAQVESSGYEGSFNLGADTQTPEQFIPEADRNAHYSYVQSQAKAIVPGGDSSSYQPEHLIPQHLKQAQVEVAPGSDSSSYQPEHLIPQHLKQAQVQSSGYEGAFNLGADTQTPEQFIPEADRIAHEKYVQSQAKTVVPGGESSSYQPQHLIPQHLKGAHVESHSQSVNLGADTQTPEQFIPEADRNAHYSYVQSQAQAVVPGGDSSSYQPQHLIPQNLQPAQVESSGYEGSFNLGADTQTPEQFIPEVPAAIGANTITPAHLYQEPVSNGIEEFNAETHVPAAIGRDTITPAHLVPKYSAGPASYSSSSASASSSSKSGHDTHYGSNGGYVY